jgi:cubilin
LTSKANFFSNFLVCGGEMIVTTHGQVSSPGAPGNYPMNRDCEWFITAPPGKRIQFLFYTLMIEAHESCGYDYVEIHGGLGVETSSLGKYCNSSNPPPLLTPGNTATIHFHSDGDSSDAGFQIAFSVVEGIPGCGGTFTASKGDIVSPTNLDDGKYKHNMVCEYVIQMPVGSRVRIEFKKFALEESSGCKFDKVEVSNADDEFAFSSSNLFCRQIFEGSVYDEETLIGRYCGESRPPSIMSQTNIVSVKFSSDWSSNDEGKDINEGFYSLS